MKVFALCAFLLCFSLSPGQQQNGQVSSGMELPSISLEEAGFNRDSIEIILELLQKTPHRDFRGMVVLKNNGIVIEEYYHTFMRNTIHDIRSAGKSITALLLGIAMKDGLIEGLDQDVYSLFSKPKSYPVHADYKKITLRDVLDMASGLDADSDNWRTVGHAGKWIEMDDWKAYLLNVPLKTKPGKRWVYADIHALLVGMAIEEASGMSLRDYAQQKLFDPLGITQVYWYTNAANQTGAAGNLYLSTLDFAKLGLLVVNEGRWGSNQVIPTSFIQELVAHKRFDLSETFPLADSYGMLWYKTSRTFGKNHMDYLFASGNGGNHLVVLPQEEMVVALTSSAYGPGYGQGRSYAILSKLLAAIE